MVDIITRDISVTVCFKSIDSLKILQFSIAILLLDNYKLSLNLQYFALNAFECRIFVLTNYLSLVQWYFKTNAKTREIGYFHHADEIKGTTSY